MTVPQWNPATQYYPPVLPPDIEWLAQAFLTPILSPVRVETRLQRPDGDAASLSGTLRIEAGNMNCVDSTWGAAFDASFLMHAYSLDEIEASEISRTAMAHVISAIGQSVLGWYIVTIPTYILGRRLSDPEIPWNMVRYRSAVTWRVTGQPPTKIQ